VVVVRREAPERIDGEGGILRAWDVVLAVEVLSPGSRRLGRPFPVEIDLNGLR
jgi:hypothetical protein